MKKTGYVVIDCTGVDLAAEATATIAGIYSAFVNAYACGKPVFVENIINDDLVYSPACVVVAESSGDFVFALEGSTVTVDADDGVTIS